MATSSARRACARLVAGRSGAPLAARRQFPPPPRTLTDLTGAERAYEDIRRTLEAAPPGEERDRGLANVYHQFGVVAQERGDLAAAEDWYRKSLAIVEALGNRPGMATSYHQLGIVAQKRGDLAAAEDWYRKSLAIDEAIGNRPGMARSYGQLSIVAQRRGDLDAAEYWYRKALAIVGAR